MTENTNTTISPAMIEAAARAIAQRMDFTETTWPKYVSHAEAALAAAAAAKVTA